MIDYFGVALRQLGFKGQFMGNTYDSIIWGDEDVISKEILDAKIAELKVEWPAQEYARNRALEYPSLLELTVALYDTDDKSAVEAKRAAVKAKYPKPE